MSFESLPYISAEKLDGNLRMQDVSENPTVLILGTATQGDSETFYQVSRISDAARTFGKTGTLARGMYEAAIAGASNMRLFRIGATSAKLVTAGLTITTVDKDDTAGTSFSLFYEGSTKRLRIYRVSDDELVYDNNPTYPLEAVDLGEVGVSGTATGTADIGSLATPITLAAANGVTSAPAAAGVYTAGTDGTDLSRMELYEALYRAYDLLSDQAIDVVVPMNIYLDDLNVMDLTAAEIGTKGLEALAAYPDPGDPDDVLGQVYVEEYQGEFRFWWWFPGNPVIASTGFVGAQIFPTGIGSATSTTTTDGTVLTADDFHEVNFGYQLADFCYRQSEQNQEMTGVIGVLPPDSLSLKDVSSWIGTLPVVALDASDNLVITTNGTGLLGNKFMAGRKSTSSYPGVIVDGIDGLYEGGFIATDDGFLDGTQQEDANEHLIDIGKHLSVVAAYPILANQSRDTSYMTTGAPTYAGFYISLPTNSAPTNKLLRSVRLPFRVGTAKLDKLATLRYVTFHAKTKGIVVSDGPTAARSDCDYRRLSTVRIVKRCIDDIRKVGEPFLGEGISGARLAALDTAIDGRLKDRVKDQHLQRYEHRLISTAQMRVLGEAAVELKLIPAFELRKITITVSLAAV
jgi:hypothetical protein